MHDSRRVAEKYKNGYAEPEVRIAEAVSGAYARAVVVPAHAESASLLDGYRDATLGAEGRTLVVLVVNGAQDSSVQAHAENARLLEDVLARGSRARQLDGAAPAWLVDFDAFDVLLLDRASVGQRFDVKQGVGLARKIGCDLALALHLDGKIASPWIHSTDADVHLATDTFHETEECDVTSAAVLYPYDHVASGDAELDWATALYEVGLRYYVLGLAHARSPYAFHTIGSTLAVHATAYAQVRGFPRRLAGEDFYLVDKLSKVGPIRRARHGTVSIQSRWSDRTPFGTGRGVRKIAEERAAGRTSGLYDPRTFEALGASLEALDAFCVERRLEAVGLQLARLPDDLRRPVEAYFVSERLGEVLVAASEQSSDVPRLRRRVATWFDGLRALKLLHAVRADSAPDLPWPTALARAPFCADLGRDLGPHAIAAELRRRELELPVLVGPTTV